MKANLKTVGRTSRFIACPTCNGSGYYASRNWWSWSFGFCFRCRGKGKVKFTTFLKAPKRLTRVNEKEPNEIPEQRAVRQTPY